MMVAEYEQVTVVWACFVHNHNGYLVVVSWEGRNFWEVV